MTSGLKSRANEGNIVDQQLPTLLDVICCIRLHNLLHVVACRFQHCWELLHRFAHHYQQLPTFLTQQCWELLRPFALSFRDKTANFSGLHCLAIPGRDLSTKKTKPKIEKWPESLGVMLDYGTWAIWALQLSEFSFLETSLQWFLLTQFLNCRHFFGVEFLEMVSKPCRTKKEDFFGCILAV